MNYKKLLVAIVGTQLAGVVGSLFTTSAIEGWYAGLVRPGFAPPNWVFAPVWITLYLLMGLAVYLVWNSKSKKSERADGLRFYLVQLGLNSLWSIVFFGAHLLWLAYLEILVLLYFIVTTVWKFGKVNKYASWMMYPYIAWVAFASFLNLAFALIN